MKNLIHKLQYLLKLGDRGPLFLDERVVFFFVGEVFFFFAGDFFLEAEELSFIRLLGEDNEDLRFRFPGS